MTAATAYGYVRVSTQGQADDGISLDAQKAKVAAWASLNDYELGEIFIDAGLSGKNCNRPGLQSALNAVSKGDALVVYSLSRLSRSIRDTMDISDKLNRKGADLVSLSEKIDTTSAAGKMVFRLLAVMNEFERDQIAERTKSALQHKRSIGERTGTIKFGYKLDEDGASLIPDESEQMVIEAIHLLHNEGLSLRKIVSRLEERGYVSRTGKPYQLKQVHRVIQNAA